MTTIASEKYVSFTSHRKDGSTKSLPVWIADLGDGTVGFTTSSSSYKVKRLRNDNRVMLQPCDQRGNVRTGTEQVTGTGVILNGAEFDAVEALIKKKYGFAFTMITMIGKMAKLIGKGSGTDTAIKITLD